MGIKGRIVQDVEIIDIANKGMSLGRSAEGKIYLVEKVVPGDLVDIKLIKKKKGLAFGTPIKTHSLSNHRETAFCDHFGLCGGCKWQNMQYASQLHFKQKLVKDAFQRIAKVEVEEYQAIIACEQSHFYRNKLEYTFAEKRWLTQEEIDLDTTFERRGLGFHIPGYFDKVVDINKCYLLDDKHNEYRNAVRAFTIENEYEYFNPSSHQGLLRNLMIRMTNFGEKMLLFIFYKNDEKNISKLLDWFQEKFPEVDSIMYIVNEKRNDSYFDQEVLLYKGKPFIVEELLGNKFKIGPKSFFQTNTRQAEQLFSVAKEYAELDGKTKLFDLYTGVGSIAISMADQCEAILGIEEVEEAIINAEANAAMNGITNTKFITGDVLEFFNESLFEKYFKPDVLVTDPPRAGMHPKVVARLLELEIPRMVYVSCNPSTQARDLALLSEKYNVCKSRTVDMFPYTSHVENVVQLKLKT